MTQQPIRFDDGEAYEHGMGVWSRSAGNVERRFADFDAFWRAGLMVGSLGERMATLTADQVTEIKARVRPMLAVDADGTVVAKGRANAVKGRRPRS